MGDNCNVPEVVREESAHSDDFSRRRSAALYLALLSVLVLVIAGLLFGQYRPTMAETAFLGFGVALLGLLGIVRGGFSVDEVLIAMVALVITALILGTCVVMWPEDVSTKTQLTVGDVKQNGDGVMQNGDTATVIVGDPPAPHRQLRLTLASDDRGIGTPARRAASWNSPAATWNGAKESKWRARWRCRCSSPRKAPESRSRSQCTRGQGAGWPFS